MNRSRERVTGLGGWLIVVGIVIVVSPLLIIVTAYPPYIEMLTGGSWTYLTTPGSAGYHPRWALVLFAEGLANLAMVLGWFAAGYLFLSRRRKFPDLYIGVLLFTIVYIMGDAIAVKSILPTQPAFSRETAAHLIATLIVCVLSIPYMLVSRRVRDNFVR